MNLVAATIVRNELSRYLPLAIDSLLTFCDEVRVIDDYSTDGTYEWLLERERVSVLTNPAVTFDEHEGKARQALLDWVREARPTHVLAIDADEFVDDGQALRLALTTTNSKVWSLVMEEVWEADDHFLWTREDGGWKQHPVPIAWKVSNDPRFWAIRNRALACGREPEAIAQLRAHATPTGTSVLHFGWTNPTERQRRYDRYMAIDAGHFHASRHLQSIMWPRKRISFERRLWPDALDRAGVLKAVWEERG